MVAPLFSSDGIRRLAEQLGPRELAELKRLARQTGGVLLNEGVEPERIEILTRLRDKGLVDAPLGGRSPESPSHWVMSSNGEKLLAYLARQVQVDDAPPVTDGVWLP